MAKAVIIMIENQLAMVVLPANRKVVRVDLREALGADQVKLATDEEFQGLFPDCQVGAMPPFGNWYGLDTCVAHSLMQEAEIALNAGTHTEVIQMASADFVRLVHPKPANFTNCPDGCPTAGRKVPAVSATRRPGSSARGRSGADRWRSTPPALTIANRMWSAADALLEAKKIQYLSVDTQRRTMRACQHEPEPKACFTMCRSGEDHPACFSPLSFNAPRRAEDRFGGVARIGGRALDLGG